MTDLEWIQQLPYKPCKEIIIPYNIYLRILSLAKRGAVEITFDQMVELCSTKNDDGSAWTDMQILGGMQLYRDELKKRSE